MIDQHPCPKCGRQLRRSGEVTIEGQPTTLAAFQCDECLQDWSFEGECFETALTFVVDAAGQVLHPETLEPFPPATN